MELPELGVKRAVTTAMIFIAVIILGAVSLTRMGLDMLPDIEIPTIAVITTYTGVGPEEVEQRVTRVAEEQLATVEDLDKIEASSSEGISVVSLRFKWGVNLDSAMNDVRDKLDMVKPRLPEDADAPLIFKFDLSMMPVLAYGVSAQESYPRLKKILEDEIAIPLESVPGVASVTVRGGLERAILVELDAQRLNAYNISINQIENMLRAGNLSTPGGHIRTENLEYVLRVPEELEISEIENVVVGNLNGNVVRIKDVAEVKDSFKETTEEAKINRRPGLVIMIQKESDANTVDVCMAIFQRLDGLKKNLPNDVEFSEPILDSSDQIIKSINNLKDSLLLGGILVIITILFFLGSFRSSLIVASAIPVSLVASFIFLYMAGYTINIISLASLAIAIGMVVDASIVVYENIHRHLEEGENLKDSCVKGGSEVAGAVFASVLCMVAIFVPIIFTGGLTAVFFKQLAYVISFALISSLFTALMLVPMLSSKFVKLTARSGAMAEQTSGTGYKDKKGIPDRIYEATERNFRKIEGGYKNLLSWALKHRKRIVVGSGLLLLVSLAVIGFIGTEFFPEEDEGRIAFGITLPIGTRYEKTAAVTDEVMDIIYEKVPEVEVSYSSSGVSSGSGFERVMGGEEGSNIGTISLKLIPKEKRERSPREIAYELKDKFNRFPDAEVRYDPSSMAQVMFGGAKPLSVELRGYDLQEAKILSEKIAGILANIRGVGDIEISRKSGKPELQIIIDRDKASSLGLNIADISHTIETCFKGRVVSWYREEGEEYDIELKLRQEDRKNLSDIENLSITLPTGAKIPLSLISHIERTTGPLQIERRGRERVVKIEGEIYGRDLGSVVAETKAKLSTLSLPSGFSIYFGGEHEEMAKSFRQLFLALILGIILVFMIMASQFESLIDPFVIMFAIPFALVGVAWALFLSGNTLSVVSFIGLIMVVGIGVETGIVLVSFIKQLREKGIELHEAVVEAGKLRLRPVLMTTLTTVFGLVPLALSKGEGSEIWVPLSLTVIGGLIMSFVLTLIFVPILYTIFEERILRFKQKTQSSAQTE
ncbi:MAG: efflux RND transporter permease subunit [Candidatus Ratteibacteria bacterium]|nr:efflux RND transporter permease subunit [Candidatus Ratteibacteria bacterium]